jgi:hypothetical protein
VAFASAGVLVHGWYMAHNLPTSRRVFSFDWRRFNEVDLAIVVDLVDANHNSNTARPATTIAPGMILLDRSPNRAQTTTCLRRET